MKTFNRLFNITSYLFLCLLSTTALAKAEVYGECYGCSGTTAISVASSLASNQSDGITPIKVHLADIKNRLVYSYRVIDRDGLLSLSATTAPTELITKMNSYKEAYTKLADEAKGLEIPDTVMESAWEYVNCSYCKNDVSDYISSTLEGQVMTVGQTINQLAQVFGLAKTDVANQFSIPLQAGGEVVVKLTVDAELNLYILIVEVIDSDNNSVPSSSSSLENLRIKIGSTTAAVNINSFINRFNWYVPIKIGKVIITDNP